jgi:hypothetical protein
MNGKVLQNFLPADYNIQTAAIPIQFEAGCDAELKFYGIGGENNSYGAFIKSVSLVQTPHCSQYPPHPQYP